MKRPKPSSPDCWSPQTPAGKGSADGWHGRWPTRRTGAGSRDVWLRVVPDNAAALRAYVAAGFVPAAADAERAFNVGQPVAYRWLHDGTSTARDVTGSQGRHA